MAPLLWIVKTAKSKSLSHSERGEQIRVYSHAQRTSRPRKASKKRPPMVEVHVGKPRDSSTVETSDQDDYTFTIDENAIILLEMCAPPAPLPGIDSHSQWPLVEQRGVKYFMEVSVYKIITLQRDMHFWKGIVPCLAELHASFRHLVVAIAVTFEMLFRPDLYHLDRIALEQCNKAIRSILSAGELDKAWLLASCILISAYNLLRSDINAADSSIENGMRMIGNTATSDRNLEQLNRIITSLRKQHGFKLWAPDITFQFDKTAAGREPMLVEVASAKGPFVEVAQVLTAFKTMIVEYVAKLMRNLALGSHIDPDSLLAQDVRQYFSDILFHWDGYYRSLSDTVETKRLELVQLRIGLQSAYVLFATKVLGTEESLCDAHTNRFLNMLLLGKEVIAARDAGKPVIYLDRIVNGALYTAAMFCCHSAIRRGMIALLKSQLKYEDGLVNYLRGQVAGIVAEYEDQGRNITSAREVPDGRLIRVTGLHCRDDRMLCVRYVIAEDLDRLRLKDFWSPLDEELDNFSLQEIDSVLKGMTAAYLMYMKVDRHVAPAGCLRRMYYRGRPVEVRCSESVSSTF